MVSSGLQHVTAGGFLPYQWPVVPISKGQLLDVRAEDLVAGLSLEGREGKHDKYKMNPGHFRVCHTDRSRVYDLFGHLAKTWWPLDPPQFTQFLVQLRGCSLDCPYCYVTREGVWGSETFYSSEELVTTFNCSPATVFHLMGGAPAIHIRHWPNLISALQRSGKDNWVFHSDLMLVESAYDSRTLSAITHGRALYAVNVKGLNEQEWVTNTRKPWKEKLFYQNLEMLILYQVPFYVTFTNVDPANIPFFWDVVRTIGGLQYEEELRLRSWNIDLVQYKALAHVDDIPWGGVERG